MGNFSVEITTILKARRNQQDTLNVFEILGYSMNDFQKAFDIALEMENQNLVKLLYSNFKQGKVIIEFTLLGKAKSSQF